MANNHLILRNLNSPWVTPIGDVTKGSVLSWADLDNNFIYLRGEVIYTAETSGSTVTLKKINGNNLSFNVGSSGNTPYTREEVSDYTSLPLSGETNVLYELQDNGDLYRWDHINNVYIIWSSSVINPDAPEEGQTFYVRLATTTRLNTCTYNNGTSGSGATLTATANGVIGEIQFGNKIDNITVNINDVILIKNQVSALQNGIYEVTDTGSVSTPFILTRVDGYNETNEIYPSIVFVSAGVNNANRYFTQSTANPVVGTNNIVYAVATTQQPVSPVLFVDTITTTPLPTCTYISGTTYASLPGNGAILSATTNAFIGTINGVSMTSGKKIIIKDQVNKAHNGSYIVTNPGSTTQKWVLTRWISDSSQWYNVREFVVSNPNSLDFGSRWSVSSPLSMSNLNYGVTNIIFSRNNESLYDLWSGSTGTESIIANNGTGNIASGDYAVAMGFATSATSYTSIAAGVNSIANAPSETIDIPIPITVISACTITLSDPNNSEPAVMLQGDVVSEWEVYIDTFCSEFLLYNTSGDTQLINVGCNYSDYYYDLGTDKTYIVDSTISADTYTTISGATFYNLPTLFKRPAFSFGVNTQALGIASHAEGRDVIASGYTSHAEGLNTLASGNMSHAEGQNTIASGETSHAEGFQTIASGQYSHAEGGYTIASGGRSHAEGQQTTASGFFTHAEGYLTIASGNSSHAEGGTTTASGNISHAEGFETIASGNISHAEGFQTQASGNYSHAEGLNTITSGSTAHAEGEHTIASGDRSHAEGGYTIASGINSHAEGGGTIASGHSSHAEGTSTIAFSDYSHAGGSNSIASGYTSFIHSTNSLVTGNRSVVLGGQNITGSTDDTVYVPNLNIQSGGNINSSNGGGQIDLDYQGVANQVFISSDNGAWNETAFWLTPTSFELSTSGGSTSLSVSELGYLSSNVNGFNLQVNGFEIFKVGKTNINTISDNNNKPSSIISSKNSTVVSGISNSTIIGGENITADTSNTVYVPNLNLKSSGSISSTNSSSEINFQDNGIEILSSGSSFTVNSGVTLTSENNINIYTQQDMRISGNFDNAGVRIFSSNLEVFSGADLFISPQNLLFITGLQTFANDALAGIGGLTTDAIYKTAIGELRIKL